MDPNEIPVIDVLDTEEVDLDTTINSPSINSPNIVDQSLVEPLLPEPAPEPEIISNQTEGPDIINTPDTINTPPPIIIPLNLLNLLGGFNNVAIDHENTLEEEIANRSFHEKPAFKQVCSKDFINSLSVQKVSPELVEKKITCGVCLDELELGEDVIELPCKDKHYFHIKRENCDGIYPWLKENNTCPMCRCEFPSIEKKCSPETPQRGQQGQWAQGPPQIFNPRRMTQMISQVLQEEEERMIQEAIYNSMN